MIVLVAGLCWAYILGEVGAIVTDMNAEKQSAEPHKELLKGHSKAILGGVSMRFEGSSRPKRGFRKMMNGLNKMMQEQGLPHELRRRLRSFFLSNKHQAQFALRLHRLQMA